MTRPGIIQKESHISGCQLQRVCSVIEILLETVRRLALHGNTDMTEAGKQYGHIIA